MSEAQADTTQKLKSACDEGYSKYPNSCSHSTWHVITSLVDSAKGYEQANALIDTLSRTWTEVDLATAGKLANQGEVVVAGQKATGNGHVIVVYPGAAKPRGGYKATITKDGKKQEITIRSTGLYPLAMSTSIGSWPGAMSCGDKTVWDPWGNDTTFQGVKFWHHDLGSAKTNAATSTGARKVFEEHNGKGKATRARYFA